MDANAQIISKKIFSGYYFNYYTGKYEPSYAGDDVAYNKIVSAVNSGANILNNSYGGSSYSTTLRMAFAYAYKMNTVAVVSMGNDSTDTPYYPAAFGQGIIAIGATNYNDIKANYSNYGNHIDVSAPGGDGDRGEQRSIQSTWRGNSYEKISGTSMAAPQVSGIASLLKGYNSSLYNDDIEHIIQISVDDVNSLSYPGWDQYLGYGRVNAKKALDYLQSPYVLSHKSASGGSPYNSTSTYTAAMFGVSGLSDGVYIVKRYEVRKTVNFGQVYQNSPYVWGRGVGSGGLSAANPNYGMGYTDVVSNTSTSAVLRTYVYEVWTIAGTYVGYIPCSPSNVTWNYTVLGTLPPLSLTISGPTRLTSGNSGTFTAHPSGGSGTYTNYQWWSRNDEGGSPPPRGGVVPLLPPPGVWIWQSQWDGYQTITFGPVYDFSLKCEVTDSDENTAIDIHSVIVGEPLPDIAKKTPISVIESIPEELTLIGNYPNPFNPTTTIKFGLPESESVSLIVYSIDGQQVRTLVVGNLSAGYHSVQWDGTNDFGEQLTTGVYIYELKAGPERIVKKMVFMR